MPIPKVLPKGKDHATGMAVSGEKASKAAGPKIIGQRYSVVNQLGSGNFGTVYLVTDTKSNEK